MVRSRDSGGRQASADDSAGNAETAPHRPMSTASANGPVAASDSLLAAIKALRAAYAPPPTTRAATAALSPPPAASRRPSRGRLKSSPSPIRTPSTPTMTDTAGSRAASTGGDKRFSP